MRGRWALAIGIGLGASALATPAAGCVLLPVTCVGDYLDCNPGPSAVRTRARESSADMTRDLTRRARMRLLPGRVNFAAELSELLVPNVRPVWATETDCGLMGEMDYGAGHESFEYVFERIVAGTPLAGRDHNPFRGLIPIEDESFGLACNAEFRRGFAAFLQSALQTEDLEQAWLFLIARKRAYDSYGSSIYPRLMRFEGEARTPPVRWQAANSWLNDQIARFVRTDRAGRALGAAIDTFWSTRTEDLAEDIRVCPESSAHWEAQRPTLLARMMELAARRQSERDPR